MISVHIAYVICTVYNLKIKTDKLSGLFTEIKVSLSFGLNEGNIPFISSTKTDDGQKRPLHKVNHSVFCLETIQRYFPKTDRQHKMLRKQNSLKLSYITNFMTYSL